MLPDAERLRKSGLFQRVYSKRRAISTELLSLFVLAKQTRGKSSKHLPLAGFVVSKKTLGKAWQRNRAKRRMREAYRQARTSQIEGQEKQLDGREDILDLPQWYALVWVAQAKILEAEFKEIVESVHYCLRKANEKFGARQAPSRKA